jgi:Protein of unknown function (DUF4054)
MAPAIPTYADLVLSQEFKFLASTDLDRQALINEFLNNAAQQVNATWQGKLYGRSVALLAVHRLVLRDRLLQSATQSQGTASVANAFLMPGVGTVQSLSGGHGSSSVSFATTKAGKEGEADYYGQTPFGIEYYSLRRRPMGAMVSSAQSRCGC